MLYNVIKPFLILMAISLSGIIIFQTIALTGYLTNETIPANVTIGNEEPTVGNVTCSSGASPHVITPLPCQNQTVNCWALVTDLNGANDIRNVTGDLGVDVSGKRACNDFWASNPTICYFSSNCTYTGINSTTRNYTCAFNDFRYFARVDYSMAKNNWSARLDATDSEGTTAGWSYYLEYVENLTAIDVQETFLNFGTMTLGETTSNDSEVNSTIANCGNGDMYVNVSGTDLPCNTQGTIPVGNLKYNGTYGSEYVDDIALTTSSSMIPYFKSFDDVIDYAINDAGSKDQVSWQISIPATGVKGLCAGNVTFYAIRR